MSILRLLFLFILVFLSSCEKDIDIELDASESQLVVDATIENGLTPVVFLSKSLDYFGKIDSTKLSASFVRNAKVSISNGTQEITLKEDSLRSPEGARIYFYSVRDDNRDFIGQLNTKYTLRITAEGKNYQAETSIPSVTRRIDSLWWEKLPLADDTNAARIIIRATDKPGLGDYIRYFTRINQEAFLPGFNSVFDDQVIDGTTYTIPVDRGFNKNAQFADSLTYFKRGDIVTIRLCNIDKQTYDFWRTFEFSFQSIGNPFSSPTRILSNVNNGALGYFGGYGCQYRTLVIPK
ncbi:MAG: hypothetical protein RL131_1270 [Bacteroidota bacterium]